MHLKHGHTRGRESSSTYCTWADMKKRCLCKTNSDYKGYGGRGIRVCDRWLKFENFLADMGAKPDGKSLDRINNDGDYEPGNCRWATPKEQAWNRRQTKLVTHNGKTQSLAAWGDEIGVHRSAIYLRIKSGMDIIEAITKPKYAAKN